MDFGNADSWGAAIYFWIFPLVIGDAIFPPLPSEMVVITGGALSAEGHINAFLVILPPLRKMLRLLLLAFFGIRFASSAASVSRVTRFSSGLHTTRGVDFHD